MSSVVLDHLLLLCLEGSEVNREGRTEKLALFMVYYFKHYIHTYCASYMKHILNTSKTTDIHQTHPSAN